MEQVEIETFDTLPEIKFDENKSGFFLTKVNDVTIDIDYVPESEFKKTKYFNPNKVNESVPKCKYYKKIFSSNKNINDKIREEIEMLDDQKNDA